MRSGRGARDGGTGRSTGPEGQQRPPGEPRPRGTAPPPPPPPSRPRAETARTSAKPSLTSSCKTFPLRLQYPFRAKETCSLSGLRGFFFLWRLVQSLSTLWILVADKLDSLDHICTELASLLRNKRNVLFEMLVNHTIAVTSACGPELIT